MKIKDGFIIKKIMGSYIVISADGNAANFEKMQTLNETGALLWGVLEKGGDIDSLTAKLLAEYDVDEETAIADAKDFTDKLRAAGLLDE